MSPNVLVPFFLQTTVPHVQASSFLACVGNPQPQSLPIHPPNSLLYCPYYIVQNTVPLWPTIQHHLSWTCHHHQPPSPGSPPWQSNSQDDQQRARPVCTLCPQCYNLPMLPNYRFCSIACSQFAARSAPRLTRLPLRHKFYIEIAHRFIECWKSASRPKVLAILMINWSDTSRRRFEEYRNSVEARGQFESLGRFPGNERKQFRGTKRACNLGEGGNNLPCLDPACWMCETIRWGFEPHLQRKRMVPLDGPGIRLGAAIYTTPVSSKADLYAENIHDPSSTIHTMLVCRAVIGEPHVTSHENPALRRPPEGYDCVYGKSGLRSHFADDEYAFYHEDAIRPAYLVVYERMNGH